eukprot:5363832-Amphidinium_carterae.1
MDDITWLHSEVIQYVMTSAAMVLTGNSMIWLLQFFGRGGLFHMVPGDREVSLFGMICVTTVTDMTLLLHLAT